MDRQISDDSESRFAAFVEGIVSVIGHADRAGPLRDYCIGRRHRRHRSENEKARSADWLIQIA